MSNEFVELCRFVLANPKDVLYDFLVFLREYHEYGGCQGWKHLRNLVLALPEPEASRYRDEIDFLKSQAADCLAGNPFPYPATGEMTAVESGFDSSRKLPFVVHQKKRLYFPRCIDSASMCKLYSGFVDVEGVLGNGRLKKSPHSYVTDGFCVENGDVLVDVGCSEAIFTLSNIEQVSKACVFEAQKKWLRPLRATFAPYADKVEIFNRFVGGETKGNQVKLDDALPPDVDGTYFIKMDIEGGEWNVLKAASDFLRHHRVKLACCLYHSQSDESRIVPLLRDLGFSVRFSDGYMLPRMGGIEFPYFRHGVAYACNYE